MKLANILATATADAMLAIVDDNSTSHYSEARRQAEKIIANVESVSAIIDHMGDDKFDAMMEKRSLEIGGMCPPAHEIVFDYLVALLERNLEIAFASHA